MFLTVSKNITQKLVESKTIESEEQEIYRYGIQQGATILLNLLTTLLIGLLCEMFLQSIVFTLAYIPLRSFAGGYHSKTPTRCYFVSVILISAVLLAIRFVPFTSLICGSLLLVSSIVILFLSPVGDKNKPLDSIEKQVYKKRAILIWLVEFLLLIPCVIFQLNQFALCLIMVLAVMAVMLVLGKLKNIVDQKHDDGLVSNRTTDETY